MCVFANVFYRSFSMCVSGIAFIFMCFCSQSDPSVWIPCHYVANWLWLCVLFDRSTRCGLSKFYMTQLFFIVFIFFWCDAYLFVYLKITLYSTSYIMHCQMNALFCFWESHTRSPHCRRLSPLNVWDLWWSVCTHGAEFPTMCVLRNTKIVYFQRRLSTQHILFYGMHSLWSFAVDSLCEDLKDKKSLAFCAVLTNSFQRNLKKKRMHTHTIFHQPWPTRAHLVLIWCMMMRVH